VRAGHHGQPAGWLSLVAAGLDSGVLDELRAAPACTSELAPRTATGDEELPEASLRVLAAGALVRHRAGGGGFPGAGPPALTDDAVRATYQAVADYHTGRCRQLPAQQAGGPPWPAIAEHAAVIARLSVALEPFVADVITTTVRDYDPVVRLVRQPTDHPFGEGPTEDDHRVVGLATLDASRDAGNRWIFPELADEGLEPWPGVRYVCFAGALQPTCGVDVTGFVERGIAFLRARRAYMQGLVPAPSTGAVPVLEQRPAVLG